MTKYKNGYLTRNSLASEIKKVVAKKHNLNPANIIINWMTRWRKTKYPSGLIAKVAKIKLHADGFEPRIFIVDQIAYQKWTMR